MIKKIRFLFVLLIIFHTSAIYSQIFPVEGSGLNYRLIGFSFPAMEKISNYTLEIALGNYKSVDSFNSKIALSLNSEADKVAAEVPFFGKDYTWRVVYTSKRSKTTYSDLHHFSTLYFHNLDTSKSRMVITKTAEAFKDAFVFVDESRILYDMDGNPVWFLPNVEGVLKERTTVRDMKMTPQGTITFLTGSKTDNKGYEMDYNGNILWKSPDNGAISGDTIEHYHHQLDRLKNGNYMMLGSVFVPLEWRFTSPNDSGLFIATSDTIKPIIKTKKYEKSPFGDVIEYDKNGKIVWSWKSSDYYKGKDLQSHLTTEMRKDTVDDHENAFFFDEKNSIIYISYKNMSLIFKLKYPSGELMDVYNNNSDDKQVPSPMFCGQHGCKIGEDGKMFLYNNYECNTDSVPSLLVMEQPHSKNGSLKKLWEYKFPLTNEEKEKKRKLSSGGNVMILPDHSIFGSMGTPYSYMFIVSQDKGLLWEGYYEMFTRKNKNWRELSTYRASIVESRKEMDKLLWSEY